VSCGLYGLGYLASLIAGSPPHIGVFLGSKVYADVGGTLIVIEVFFFGYGEEVGWRGYALGALQDSGRTAHSASTVLAVFWAPWHLPLFFCARGSSTPTAWRPCRRSSCRAGC
jgi:membrane protease YdiL (CAAX protease family)